MFRRGGNLENFFVFLTFLGRKFSSEVWGSGEQ